MSFNFLTLIGRLAHFSNGKSMYSDRGKVLHRVAHCPHANQNVPLQKTPPRWY